MALHDRCRNLCSVALILFFSGVTLGEAVKERVTLPVPLKEGRHSLEKMINNRRSVRKFIGEKVSLQEVSQLLWAAGGVTVDGTTGATRAYPSAGGLYPLRFYVVPSNVEGLAHDVYQYEWKNHSLLPMNLGDRVGKIIASTHNRSLHMTSVGLFMILAADISVTTSRYSGRGEVRYIPIEAGASAQNIALQAQSLGLGTYLIGAFDDDKLAAAIKCGKQQPLLLIPIGRVEQ